MLEHNFCKLILYCSLRTKTLKAFKKIFFQKRIPAQPHFTNFSAVKIVYGSTRNGNVYSPGIPVGYAAKNSVTFFKTELLLEVRNVYSGKFHFCRKLKVSVHHVKISICRICRNVLRRVFFTVHEEHVYGIVAVKFGYLRPSFLSPA